MTITRFARPHRVEFALTSTKMDVDIAFTLTERDAATIALGTFDARPKGIMKLLLPLLMPMIRRDVAKQHVNFKRLCETR